MFLVRYVKFVTDNLMVVLMSYIVYVMVNVIVTRWHIINLPNTIGPRLSPGTEAGFIWFVRMDVRTSRTNRWKLRNANLDLLEAI